ncbi:hypothetical protein DOTSEDRAFT_159405 [Dothistroma septosporum NZE10]|uniref:Uncharacterized protein n=1 Tax=Dothistroma septosporum (strain NZE10 / CBS 128990) TaxID=675120 RepID=M2WJS8_DOTSN|nr:hypothetical protein DOTSEDRAFT_159405 [Dothistroma septosporum NZE10]
MDDAAPVIDAWFPGARPYWPSQRGECWIALANARLFGLSQHGAQTNLLDQDSTSVTRPDDPSGSLARSKEMRKWSNGTLRCSPLGRGDATEQWDAGPNLYFPSNAVYLCCLPVRTWLRYSSTTLFGTSATKSLLADKKIEAPTTEAILSVLFRLFVYMHWPGLEFPGNPIQLLELLCIRRVQSVQFHHNCPHRSKREISIIVDSIIQMLSLWHVQVLHDLFHPKTFSEGS